MALCSESTGRTVTPCCSACSHEHVACTDKAFLVGQADRRSLLYCRKCRAQPLSADYGRNQQIRRAGSGFSYGVRTSGNSDAGSGQCIR